MEDFDLVILGGGTGSTIAGWTFAGEGMRVAVVDRRYIGGSCPNVACLPSKNVIHSAKVASYFRRSKEFGTTHNGFTIDMSGVRERKREMVRGLNDVYLDNYGKTGAEFILGTGRFVAQKTVELARVLYHLLTPVPSGINSSPWPHQRDQFLRRRRSRELKAGVLMLSTE